MTRKHLTWYIKIPLTEDVSLRYYYTFEDRKHLENEWVIKSHSDKKYATISTDACKLIAKAFSEILGKDVEKDAVEVIGRSVTNKKYRKIEIPVTYENEVSKLPEYIDTTILKNDEVIDSCEYIGVQDCQEACNELLEQAVADSEEEEETGNDDAKTIVIDSFEDLMNVINTLFEESGK